MLYAGIDIHKRVFQAVVLDAETGELRESRFEPSREQLGDWAIEWQGKLAAVAIEATTGWRWVARELAQRGFEVHLIDPGRASALQGRRRRPKTDRLDARWLALLLARDLLSECESWLPPAEIQRLRDKTRLRKTLAGERTGWAQRLHALLTHEGWPCARGRLLTAEGRRWVDGLQLDPYVRTQVEVMLAMIASCAPSPAPTSAAKRWRRSSASARSSPAICSPRSATLAASNEHGNSSAPAVSTRP
jgi:transposase